MREDYRTAAEWWLEQVGAKALILIGPAGASFILRKTDKQPLGKYALKGIL